MDVARENARRNRIIRRVVYGVVALAGVAAATVSLSRLKPAAPSVERSTVWVDTVRRGPMVREVRGPGSLVPKEVLWIPAPVEGRVARIPVLPGTVVTADTVLVELSSPDLQQSLLEADYQLKAAEAGYAETRVKLQSDYMRQKADAVGIQAQYESAKLQADLDERKFKAGVSVELTAKLSRINSDQLANRYAVEQERVKIGQESDAAQLAAQQAQVNRARALYEAKRVQVDSLHVRAGAAGVLQQLPVEIGQRIAGGAILAKVVQPERLKAELKIPETQAKDVQIGQQAAIDTRNGIIPGHVTRIDPAVQNGTVTVDVAIEGPLPAGARPDLSVDGTIEIEKLNDVLYVGRPVFGQPGSTIGIFRLINGGKEAVRVQVKLGRASVSTIEIVAGLQVGDQVVLSDMAAWDAFERIRLN
jgi:HlyD family secretion protein